MDLFTAAKQFDKIHKTFRIDVLSIDPESVRVCFLFYPGQSSAAAVHSAIEEFFHGIHHQVRPFGRCSLIMDPVYEELKVLMVFLESKISDVGLIRLLNKVVLLGTHLSTKYGL